MATIERPILKYKFSDWSRSHPREPHPGDRLDEQFTHLISAIQTTQAALAELRRDDGRLVNRSVGSEQLADGLLDEIITGLNEVLDPVEASVRGIAYSAMQSEQNAALFAKDAESAVSVARQMVAGLQALRQMVDARIDYVQRLIAATGTEASDAENWANYSKAQADNAIKAKDEALAWAEYLAGPVVDATKAPAYIADSPFPNGLYYQPVEGGIAGLWSAKWWALYAHNLVGNVGTYFLGTWPSPPLPGQIDPNTGKVVPSPILVGSVYFDSTQGTMLVWDGLQWKQPFALTSTFQARFAYVATAGQTVFSGADMNGVTPDVGTSPSEVHVNGVLLLPDEDYDVDAVTSTLTINTPLTAGSVVQWDLLVPSSALAPGTVNAFKMQALTPDGVTADFTLSYIDPIGGDPVPADVGDGAQLMVSLDGCVQEPGAAYTASGSNLHFNEVPDITASIWAVWYQPGAPAP